MHEFLIAFFGPEHYWPFYGAALAGIFMVWRGIPEGGGDLDMFGDGDGGGD